MITVIKKFIKEREGKKGKGKTLKLSNPGPLFILHGFTTRPRRLSHLDPARCLVQKALI